MGVGPGQRVGLLLPNTPEYLASLQGVWLTGATALQLSPLMVAEEIRHWVESTGCKIVITLDLLAPAVVASLQPGLLENVILTSLAGRMALWQSMFYTFERLRRNGYLFYPGDARQHRFEWLLAAEPMREAVSIDPKEDVAVLAPTGGTTASPKAVMLTHSALLANAMQLRHWCGGEDTEDGVLAVLPFFHAYGLTVSLLSSWAGAHTMHLHPRFEAKAVLGVIENRKPTIMPAVPAMLSALNKQIAGRKIDLSFVRAVVSGASALNAEVRKEFEKTGVQRIVEGYGLTEASPVTHVNPNDQRNRPGSLGLALPDTEALIVDPDTGHTAPVGEVGELLIRGPQLMKGYFNNPAASEAALAGGYLHTGDMVRCDEQGFATLVDRKRDIIKTSGFLVYPAEVEEVLRAMPEVAEAAVVGIEDEEKGEVVKALVVAKSGASLTVAQLEAYAKIHLGKHKRPKKFELVTELPKNFLGKVLRRKLREGS
jgi:long-chain acyl-CoA synthetase